MMKKIFMTGLVFLNSTLLAFAQSGVEETSEYLTSFGLPSVYTPAHMMQSATEAPAIIKVITREQILRRGYATVMEVLCDTVGISSDISNEFISLIKFRGSSTTGAGILFLLNGQKVNSPFYDGIVEFLRMQTDQVRQIEIVRGPGGAIWGAGAFEGVVNILTKQNCDENQVAVSAAFGSDQYRTGNLLVNCRKEDYFLDINYDYYESNQFQLGVDHDFGDTLGDSPLNIFLRKDIASLTPGVFEQEIEHKIWNGTVGKGGLRILYYYTDSSFNSFGAYNFLVGKGYALGCLDYCVKPLYSVEINEKLQCEFSYARQKMETGSRRKGYAGTPGRFGFNADFNGDGVPEYWPDGIRAQYKVETTLDDFECILSSTQGSHALKLGFLYQEMEVATEKDMRNINFSGPFTMGALPQMTDYRSSSPMIRDTVRKTKAFYFQDVFSLSEELSFVAGTRYEDLSDLGHPWSSRAGIIRHFDGGFFKLLYGEGFRPPSVFELYSYYDSEETWSMGNPDLEMERVSTLESSLGFDLGERTELDLNLYYTVVRDKIFRIAHSESARGYYNHDRYRVKGIESELIHRLDRISFFLQYAYTHADKDFLEDINAIYPIEHSVGAGFDSTPLEQITFYFGYFYEGEIERYWEEGDLPCNHYANTNLTWKITEQSRVSFSISNLFNETNYYSGFKNRTSDIERPGRNMILKLQYSF